MKKITKKDQVTILQAYHKKIEEYSQMSLEELKDLYPKLGGTYKIACIHVTEKKLREVAQKNFEEAVEDIKEKKDEQTESN